MFRHLFAVYRAEYYTTTAKFRSIRKWIPLFFFGGVLIFGYMIRSIMGVVTGNQTVDMPPLNGFFSILAIFSYFTLFAPLLSARVIYDNKAQSRREVALSSPVSSKDLLFGNLLSNLTFFIPFFALVGTTFLTPFIGNGFYSPLLTAIFLILILSVLIFIGLAGGTLLSPLIFDTISKQRSDISRAMVTLGVSAMLITTLPLLKYFLNTVSEVGTNLGALIYLPFVISASLIIYVLYGIDIGITPLNATLILLAYALLVILLGWISAEKLYDLSKDVININSSNPNSKPNQMLDVVLTPVPKSIRSITASMIRSSFRDPEHLARMTIGMAIAIFMIYALSSQGLFEGTVNFDERIELSMIIFSLVLSAASVIYIDSATFTISHKQMFSLIKSSPTGPRKVILAKSLEMLFFSAPLYLLMINALSLMNFISASNRLLLSIIVVGVIFALIGISIAIALVNPADNQEDLSNFINLLAFYVISFVLAIIPIAIFLTRENLEEISLWPILIYFLVLVVLTIGSLILGIYAFDVMNVETLDSDFSRAITHTVKTFGLFLLAWNILPIFAIQYILLHEDIYGYLLLSSLLTLLIPLMMGVMKLISWPSIKLKVSDLRKFLFSLLLMFITLILVMLVLPSPSSYSFSTISILFEVQIRIEMILALLVLLVIVEEVFFRWFILDYSLKQMTTNWAILLSSLLFAILHMFSLLSLVNALIQAIILAKLRLDTRSITWPILAHLIYNGVLIFLAF